MTIGTQAYDQYLDTLKRNRGGSPIGIVSVCSAHPAVIKAALRRGIDSDTLVLIESTSNQVNQYGGYTGMKPADFVDYVAGIAEEVGFDQSRLLLGGDHLGPNPWQSSPAKDAMAEARELISEYVRAGYRKIHIDASMFLADDAGDRSAPLSDDVVAERTADLCRIAEDAAASDPSLPPPLYVVGTEVPIPGGAQESEESIEVTRPEDVQHTVDTIEKAFTAHGLAEPWKRVMAVVVQPGVEFGDDYVFDYDPGQATQLRDQVANLPDLVFEAHSTDYQTEEGLSNLVRDHFCILKVGPWLTFAYREALFALCDIETELLGQEAPERSRLRETLEEVMLEEPTYWQKYYHGSESDKALKRKYSYSDRSRYYWQNPRLKEATGRLFSNLRATEVPLPMLSQYLPGQYTKVRAGHLKNDPEELTLGRIDDVLGIYERASAS
jgi:D-tagatose-1,6-bisphosphate aldolase subunit GatZ/KbaZ